jgi:hypothetical protein
VTIAVRGSAGAGKIEVHCKSIGRVSRDGAALVDGKDYTFDREARVLAVPFAGATSLVIEQAVSVFAPDPVVPPVVSRDAGCRAGGAAQTGDSWPSRRHQPADAAATRAAPVTRDG